MKKYVDFIFAFLFLLLGIGFVKTTTEDCHIQANVSFIMAAVCTIFGAYHHFKH